MFSWMVRHGVIVWESSESGVSETSGHDYCYQDHKERKYWVKDGNLHHIDGVEKPAKEIKRNRLH